MSRIDEIRERCEKATKGPWEAVTRGNTVKSHAVTVTGYYFSIAGGISKKTGNADFIANARQDIPYLLGEIDRLNGLVGCGCGLCLSHNNMQCPKRAEGGTEDGK